MVDSNETAETVVKKAPAAKKAPAKKAGEVVETPKAARVQLLKVHHLRPAEGSKKARTRVGRGEGSKGKTAGRGTKGHEGPLPGARRPRGWQPEPDHARPEAPRLQEPVPGSSTRS